MALEPRVRYLEAQLDGLAQTVTELRKLKNGDDDADDGSSVSLPSTIAQPTHSFANGCTPSPTTILQNQNEDLQEENRKLRELNVHLEAARGEAA